MKKFILALSVTTILSIPNMALASDHASVIDVVNINKSVGTVKGSAQRNAMHKMRRSFNFSSIGDEYTHFKEWMQKEYGLDFSLDISYMGQRGAPSGKKNSMQTIYYPSITWTAFDNDYGVGTFNFAYNAVRYGGTQASNLANRIGVATPINDYDTPSNAFDELYFSYQFGGNWDWLTVAVGQFPMYNFDGSAYNSNQQVNFINYALSQNASSTYPTASLGMYTQISPNDEWSFTLGAQDATNVSGESIKTNDLNEEHFATFAGLTYSPTIPKLGDGQYSILLYNQPGVDLQTETTNGWSINLSQNIGEKLNVFARVNGVSGNVATINQSWVLGAVYNNPLDRNPLDQIGLAFAYNKIDEKAVGEELSHESEKIIEAYWAWGVSKWMTITPDIQFYIDPAENDKSDYATVFTLRTTLFF